MTSFLPLNRKLYIYKELQIGAIKLWYRNVSRLPEFTLKWRFKNWENVPISRECDCALKFKYSVVIIKLQMFKVQLKKKNVQANVIKFSAYYSTPGKFDLCENWFKTKSFDFCLQLLYDGWCSSSSWPNEEIEKLAKITIFAANFTLTSLINVFIWV